MSENKILIFLVIIIYIITNFRKYNNFQIIDSFENLKNNHFKIIVTTYNPGINLLKKCLNSIEIQNYKNYEVCIIDDSSTKEKEEIYNLLNEYNSNFNWKYLQSEINYGPCYSRNKAIEILNPKKNDIIVCVDGDDELFDKNVLKKLNNYYQNENLLITFGNYVEKNKIGKVKGNMKIKFKKGEIDNIIKKKNYRKYRFAFSHLKTFKFKLYNKINKKDLKKNDNFIRSSTDIAIMLPMLEMAGKNIKFINDKLYKYTIDHQESFHTNINRKKKQKADDNYIRTLSMYEEVNFDKKYKIYYINLDKRKDRKINIENQIKKLNDKLNIFTSERINAIDDLEYGGIGCGKSHIIALNKAKKNNLDFIIILEDDIILKNQLIKKYFEYIDTLNDWDVIILSGHGQSIRINDLISKAYNIQTTGCYIVKKHYYDKLINNFQESVDNMNKLRMYKKDINYKEFAIDQNWKKLQPAGKWYIFNDNLGYQADGYSNIEKKNISYTDILN